MSDLLEKFKIIEGLSLEKEKIRKSEQKVSKKLHLDSVPQVLLEEEIVYWKPEQECWDEKLKQELNIRLKEVFRDKDVRIHIEPITYQNYKMIQDSIKRSFNFKDLTAFAEIGGSEVNIILSAGEKFATLDITYFIEFQFYTKDYEQSYRKSCIAFKDYSQRPGILRKKINHLGKDMQLIGLRFRLNDNVMEKFEKNETGANI